jgi:exodeoxyribonuclease VII large subunit
VLPLDPLDPLPDREPTLRVSELTAAIQVALEVCFPDEVWVRGEIGSLHRARSGHVYFELIEPTEPGAPPAARLSVTLFATEKASVNATLRRVGGVRMTDGVEIRIRGRVGVYGPQGQLQLRMSAIDPEYTLGRLASDRDAILGRLRLEGLLERNGQLTLSPRPHRVGLVTSAGSAAEADFLHELEQGRMPFDVVVVHSAVQGRDADRSLARALVHLTRQRVDVVALVRGGGARSDLAAFDSEHLARAIASATVPVLTGIGHETDSSVADLVAHTACKTPTACAAHLVARADQFQRQVDELWRAVTARAVAATDDEARRVRRRAVAVSRSGTAALDVAATRLDERRERLVRVAPRALIPVGHRLDAIEARVRALDPQRTLARGWSITRRADGRIVRDAREVAVGDVLVTALAIGEVTSEVTANDGLAHPDPDGQDHAGG